MTKTAGISKGMAQWIEDFVAGLSQDKLNKKADNEQQIDTNTTPSTDELQTETPCDPSADQATVDYFNNNKTAAINVYDLPKVVWNDETFYVLFDEETGKATILNQFTNVVTTIQARTIEEVDEALNSLQIVTSREQDMELKTAEENNEQEMDGQQIDEVQDFPVEDGNDEATDENDIIKQMQSQINSLTEQITILQQQYARVEQLQNLDLGVQESEVEHFNETAQQTEEQIQEDNSKDITTPEGRSTLRERLLNDLNDVIDEIPSDNNLEPETLDSNMLDEESPMDESSDLEQDENVADPIEFDEPAVVEEQMYMEDAKEQKNKLDDFSNEESENLNEDEDEFEVVSGKDAMIFKKAVCPYCGGDLVKVNAVKSFQGIICKGECQSEYAVNLDNETIFKKRGAR